MYINIVTSYAFNTNPSLNLLFKQIEQYSYSRSCDGGCTYRLVNAIALVVTESLAEVKDSAKTTRY